MGLAETAELMPLGWKQLESPLEEELFAERKGEEKGAPLHLPDVLRQQGIEHEPSRYRDENAGRFILAGCR